MFEIYNSIKYIYIYIVDPNTQKLNINTHDPHLPYPTESVSYASYDSKRHSGVALAVEGTGTVMTVMAQPARSPQRQRGMNGLSPPNGSHNQEMRRAYER